jgi:hypothetical protein
MAQAFRCQSRKTPMDPRVTTRETLDSRSSVSTCRDRGSAWVAPEGSCDWWGRGRVRESRIDEPGQTLTRVRLMRGDGASGLSCHD